MSRVDRAYVAGISVGIVVAAILFGVIRLVRP